MKTDLRSNENILRNGRANMQRGIETVGGKLFLTNKRLIFEAHAVNFQSGSSELELYDITSIEPRWTKLLGLIPVVPNSLGVGTSGGDELSFVLPGRQEWKQLIEQAIAARPGP